MAERMCQRQTCSVCSSQKRLPVLKVWSKLDPLMGLHSWEELITWGRVNRLQWVNFRASCLGRWRKWPWDIFQGFKDNWHLRAIRASTLNIRLPLLSQTRWQEWCFYLASIVMFEFARFIIFYFQWLTTSWKQVSLVLKFPILWISKKRFFCKWPSLGNISMMQWWGNHLDIIKTVNTRKGLLSIHGTNIYAQQHSH